MTVRLPKIGLVYNLKRLSPGEDGYEREAEFDSASTVGAIAAAIGRAGFEVVPVEADAQLPAALTTMAVDVVFNIAEGKSGRARESQVPAICDFLGLECTGGDATALAVSHDKDIARRLVGAAGLRVPRGVVHRPAPNTAGMIEDFQHALALTFPVIVKPAADGSSKGVYPSSVVGSGRELHAVVDHLREGCPDGVLVEEYIAGREFTVALLEGPPGCLEATGTMEIRFLEAAGEAPVYSFAIKSGAVPFRLPTPEDARSRPDLVLGGALYEHLCPPPLPAEQGRAISVFAERAAAALALRDVARVDLRMSVGGEIFFIEANGLPGLAPDYSDLVMIAGRCGIGYDQLIARILAPAVTRWRRA